MKSKIILVRNTCCICFLLKSWYKGFLLTKKIIFLFHSWIFERITYLFCCTVLLRDHICILYVTMLFMYILNCILSLLALFSCIQVVATVDVHVLWLYWLLIIISVVFSIAKKIYRYAISILSNWNVFAIHNQLN